MHDIFTSDLSKLFYGIDLELPQKFSVLSAFEIYSAYSAVAISLFLSEEFYIRKGGGAKGVYIKTGKEIDATGIFD